MIAGLPVSRFSAGLRSADAFKEDSAGATVGRLAGCEIEGLEREGQIRDITSESDKFPP